MDTPRRQIGFNTENSEKRNDIYIDKWVNIVVQGGGCIGKMVFRSPEKIVLQPSLLYEPFYEDGGRKDIPHYRLETELPVEINFCACQGIKPVSQEFLERLIALNNPDFSADSD